MNIVAPANYYDWRERNTVFEEITAYFGSDDKAPGLANMVLTGEGPPERIRVLGTSANFFSVLGVRPQPRRAFLPAEEWEGQADRVMLRHGF